MANPEDPQLVLTATDNATQPLSASPEATEQNVHVQLGATRIAFLFLVAFAACILLYLALATPGKWWSPVRDRAFGTDELVTARGSAVREHDELVLTHGGGGGETIISVVTNLPSRDYPLIAWIAIDVPDSAQVVLLWSTDFEPARVNKIPIRVVSGRLLPVRVAADPHWIGRITGLALAIHGPLTQPIRMRGVIAKSADAKETLADRFHEWTAFEPWTGASVNTVTGGADIQDLPLPPLLFIAVVLASAGFAWAAHMHLRASAPSLAIAAATLFVMAWFLLDARWIFNLARQAHETITRYGGKGSESKHLASDDGPLFSFIEKVRKLLPPEPARVFVLADANYFRGRAAYHLYPHNVWHDPYFNSVPPADRLRPGDFIVIYQRRGVQYDAAQRRLRWDGNVTIPAELKLASEGGALFVVE